MNRKSQAELGAILVIAAILLVVMVLGPFFKEIADTMSCQNEKSTIADLGSKLNNCNNQLLAEQQNTQQIKSNLTDCQSKLSDCNDKLQNCTLENQRIREECAKKEQPQTSFYFIKVYEDKTILFEYIIIYNIQLFGLFFAIGITFSISLFKIEIQLLDKKHQKELIEVIKEYLAEHPYAPILIVVVIIVLTNLIQLLKLFNL